jgi:hypothetical protein
VNHPNIIRQLHCVHDPERIAPERQSNLKYTGAQALQRFGDIRLATLRRNSSMQRGSRKASEFFQRRLDPGHKARLSNVWH